MATLYVIFAKVIWYARCFWAMTLDVIDPPDNRDEPLSSDRFSGPAQG